MRSALLVGFLGGLLAGCSGRGVESHGLLSMETVKANAVQATGDKPYAARTSSIAAYPDRGGLVAYGAQEPLRHGASLWHPVRLSEAHALRAAAEGTMVVDTPDGKLLRLQYERHIEHPDGNWTWIGHAGARGARAIVTFGEKAVFGSIPYGNEKSLQVTTAFGRTWLIETDERQVRDRPGEDTHMSDFLAAPNVLARARSGPKANAASKDSVKTSAITATTAATTVDIVLGYTTGFATRLGGPSQARTRLDHLVDITNQAYLDSEVDAEVRLVQTVQVDYPDATLNTTALFALTGVSCTPANDGSHRLPDAGQNCTSATRPAALQPLVDAREQYGADLVSLVRIFNSPENGSCGVGWLLGAGQVPIVAADADFGFSVVADTSGNQFPDQNTTCREDYLAHELGHNLGLQHDRATAQGVDDTDSNGNLLDPEEFGRYPYTFGYSTDETAGNFYTIMAQRRAGQTGYRVFSNPRITFCGGLACGVVDQADDARGLPLTMPVIAAFRSTVVPIAMPDRDFDGDGQADILWRNSTSGANTIWRSANAATQQAVATVSNQAWKVVGVGDFNGDGQSDILWRNSNDGRNTVWRSGSVATQQAVATVGNQAWKVVGVGDFDGDGVSDILWRNSNDGRNLIWRSANVATQQTIAAVGNQAWKVVGVGDFDGDGQSDILWRNSSTGANTIWKSASAATQQAMATVPSQAWMVVGVGDFNADGRSDILWRNSADGRNTIWLSGSSATQHAVATVGNTAWKVAKVGDFDDDGQSDILWRNSTDGRNLIWKSASSATQQAINAVPSQAWVVVG